MKYKTYSASVESMQEEIDTLRRQLEEAEAKAQRDCLAIYNSMGEKLALAEQDARRWSLFSKWWFRYWKDGNWEDDISAAKTPKELVDAIDAAIAAGEGES